MDLTSSTALVTGANRGLGRAIVAELLDRGMQRVFATARDTAGIPRSERVTPVRIDLLDPATIRAAAQEVDSLDLLVNNASTAIFTDPFVADPAAVDLEMRTNFVGTAEMVRTFLPLLEKAPDARIVNVLTLLSYAPIPAMAGYSASKAAAHSWTQSIRPGLQARGIRVHGVYPGGIDTDMLAGFDLPKAGPADVAAAILDGVVAGEEDIYPDGTSRQMSQVWAGSPKEFERAFAGS